MPGELIRTDQDMIDKLSDLDLRLTVKLILSNLFFRKIMPTTPLTLAPTPTKGCVILK